MNAARRFALAALLALAAGCASVPEDPEARAAFEETNDPLEPMNRYFFEVNYAVDELILKPFAGWYYIGLPKFARNGIRNALRNLNTPIILGNDLLQAIQVVNLGGTVGSSRVAQEGEDGVKNVEGVVELQGVVGGDEDGLVRVLLGNLTLGRLVGVDGDLAGGSNARKGNHSSSVLHDVVETS